MITNEKLKLQFRGDDNMKLLKLPLGILTKGRVLLISLGKSHEFSGLMFSHLVVNSDMGYKGPVTISVSMFA